MICTGLDHNNKGVNYKVSIPMARVLDLENKVMIATEIDGSILPVDHGYPLRLVVPGYIGVRQCKWLKSLEISDQEAYSKW